MRSRATISGRSPLSNAVPPASPWARRARFLSGLSQLNLKKLDDAFGTYKALADEEPTPTVLNNLGVVQLRRGGNPQSGVPTYYFDKAAQADPDDPDYFFNLGYAYWAARDYPAAMYWLRETVRRSPADGDAHFVLGAALAASGNAAESTREKELARRLSSTYDEWEKRPAAEQVPKGLERVKNNEVELPHGGGSTRRSRRPGSGISRSSPRSIWIARGACSSRKAIGKPWPSSIARCICRRTSPTPTCCSGGFTCGTDARARPSTR